MQLTDVEARENDWIYSSFFLKLLGDASLMLQKIPVYQELCFINECSPLSKERLVQSKISEDRDAL